MTDFEGGVLNPVLVSDKAKASVFAMFENAFDPTERPLGYFGDYDNGAANRRRDAAFLAFEGKQYASFNYRSRITTAACWADDKQTAQQRSSEILTLYNTVEHYAGETVLRFITGGPEDIDTSVKSGGEVRIEAARIMPEPGLAHVLVRAQDKHRPEGYPTALFARFLVGIPIMQSGQVIRYNDGHITHKPMPAAFMTARHGIVSLSENPDVYHATRRETVETLLFGDDEANQVFEQLSISDETTHGLFDEAAGTYGELFSISKSFPDLSFLDPRKRPVVEAIELPPQPDTPPATFNEIEDLLKEMSGIK